MKLFIQHNYKVSIWAIKKDDSSIIIFLGYIISYFIVISLGDIHVKCMGWPMHGNFISNNYYIFFSNKTKHQQILSIVYMFANSSAAVLNYMSYWYVLHFKSFVTRHKTENRQKYGIRYMRDTVQRHTYTCTLMVLLVLMTSWAILTLWNNYLINPAVIML